MYARHHSAMNAAQSLWIATSSNRLFSSWPIWLFLLLLVVAIRPAEAQEAGEVVSLIGIGEVQRGGGWQALAVGAMLQTGETIRTGAGSRVAIQLANGSQFKLNANSQLELKEITTPTQGVLPTSTSALRSIIHFINGEIWVRSVGEPLEIETVPATATIRGTEFNLAVERGATVRLAVVDGVVEFHNPHGSVRVAANEQATARVGESPRKTVLLNPLDAVQWSLYYPGVVSYRDYALTNIEPSHRAERLAAAEQRATAAPSDMNAQIEWGEIAFDSGQRATARTALTRALRLEPRNARAHTGLGWVLLTENALARALTEFQQAQPPTRMSLAGAANALYQLNRLEEADAVIRAAQQRYPDAPLPWTQAALNHLVRGQVAAAQQALDQALARAPDDALAHGLRSNIYLTQNQKARALDAAQRAVAAHPTSPSAYLDLSLAKQAEFQLETALEAAQQAVALDPDDPRALIQESRLLFGFGRVEEAFARAEQARQRAPQDAVVNSTWGFLQLARNQVNEAIQAFEAAIAQDSTLGEPHLGLGIAWFRRNQTAAAVEELRKATLLEPQTSLYNSYLGKAYYEIKQDRQAKKYFAIAKQLDPHDPTPYFYDAVRLQSVNQPVEAVQDLQKSVELNDDRAVYRSRLLLDEDLAAKAVTLGRMYNEIGFEQLGLNAGRQSLSSDPANASAHRLLADAYSALPQYEIARVSELLQAQLLQPLNITPVQPQLAETNLFMPVGAGPTTPSLYEFNSLFVRNQPTLFVSGLVGNQNTWGDDVIVSGLTDRFSYSIGQFHYQGDGFRENDDLQHDIYDFFVQTAVTPDFNLQAEYRHRETTRGDLRLNFDDSYTSDRTEITQDTARVGARYSLSPQTSIIASLIYVDGDNTLSYFDYDNNFRTRTPIKQGYQAEAQLLYKINDFNLVTGVGTYMVDNNVFSDGIELYSVKEQQKIGYSYANIKLPENLIWTVGLSDQSSNGLNFNLNELSPKFGIQWLVNDHLSLRAAAFKTVKRALTADQSIEPTQVAGFNQFFEDANGTVSKRYGIGLDVRFNAKLFGGVELSRREMEIPIGSGEFFEMEQDQEDVYRAYLYWLPDPQWAVTTEYLYEGFEVTEGQLRPLSATVPTQLDTTSIPLTLRYFNPSGFFAKLGATYVHQDVQNMTLDYATGATAETTGRENFVLVDTGIGYRLPKRQGIMMLEANNLLNEKFHFQDYSFNTDQNSNPRFLPERTLFARFVLQF